MTLLTFVVWSDTTSAHIHLGHGPVDLFSTRFNNLFSPEITATINGEQVSILSPFGTNLQDDHCVSSSVHYHQHITLWLHEWQSHHFCWPTQVTRDQLKEKLLAIQSHYDRNAAYTSKGESAGDFAWTKDGAQRTLKIEATYVTSFFVFFIELFWRNPLHGLNRDHLTCNFGSLTPRFCLANSDSYSSANNRVSMIQFNGDTELFTKKEQKWWTKIKYDV